MKKKVVIKKSQVRLETDQKKEGLKKLRQILYDNQIPQRPVELEVRKWLERFGNSV